MPIFLGIAAVVLIASAIRGTLVSDPKKPGTTGLFNLLQGDFIGSNNFLIWLAAIVGLGMLGYIKPIQPIVNAFLGLVVLVLLLSHQGFFAQFFAAAKSTTTAVPNTGNTSPTQPLGSLPTLNTSGG